MAKKGFTPLEKASDFGQWPSLYKTDSDLKPVSAQPVRELCSLTGFTIVELLIVVLIIGILAGIGLPTFARVIEKARSGEALVAIGLIRESLDRYWYQKASVTTNINQLDIDNPNSATNRLYSYSITDDGTTGQERRYTITGDRTSPLSGINYWIKWKQDGNTSGRLLKSDTLGGPSS